MPGRTWYWFCSRSSFAIILIISTVRWVARAEGRDEGKKDQEDAQKCECGWQQCSGYLAKVETSNTSVFSVIQGAFSGKIKKQKKARCGHGPRVKCILLTTAESRKALLFLAFALITCSYVIFLPQPGCTEAKTQRLPWIARGFAAT